VAVVLLLLLLLPLSSCGKVFWMGPKSQAAIDLLSSLFTNGKTVPTPLQSWRQVAQVDAQLSAAEMQAPL
jgi:hypothetical protein